MNHTDIRIRSTVIRMCAAAALCAACGAHAQTVHKHVDAEGRTTFGDQPAEPAAVLVREGSRFLSYRRSAQIDASEASLRLVRAQFALERAAAPVQDDDHASRARYVQRQAALQRVVDQAQLRVDETHAAAPLPRGAR